MPVLPGAAPFAAAGDDTGVLLLHGFTGNPISMRPWAEHLAAAGHTVRLPLLPGHGTRWQDLAGTRWPDWYGVAAEAFDELCGQCGQVFVCGLSMGGTLALLLAAERGAQVAGVVVVNASLDTADRRAPLLRALSRIVRSVPPIGDDIHKPGVSEGAYDRLPLRAAASLQQLWRVTRARLGDITAPILAFRSVVDHVVPASSLSLLRAGAVRCTVTERLLERSYHVATLDYDADEIFTRSLAFIHAHRAPTPAAS
ncbi:MAG TPA: alpha/beta fold hydrolase [Mycobacteriales bacterium]|nr:alpha/beta fold hydrolase [Mycobacteriales bacterium]